MGMAGIWCGHLQIDEVCLGCNSKDKRAEASGGTKDSDTATSRWAALKNAQILTGRAAADSAARGRSTSKVKIGKELLLSPSCAAVHTMACWRRLVGMELPAAAASEAAISSIAVVLHSRARII